MVRSLKSVVLICFLLSGVSSLIYEVVWTRLFVLVFGTTTFAVSSVLVAFMAGLALGSWWLGRFADRFSRPVFLYGLLEVGISLYALFIPAMTGGLVPLSQWLWRQWQPSFYTFSLMRFLLAFAILLLPTTLMGGTLPILSKFYATRKEQVGFSIGLLYGLNTLGAVIGAVAAGFVLLPEVGMRSTTQAAVTINLLVGFFAIAIGRTGRARVTVAEAEPVATAKSDLRPQTLDLRPQTSVRNPQSAIRRSAIRNPQSASVILVVLIAFALSGFVAMIYEVAWTRLLTLILGSSTYAFTIMLATFLVGLALGSFLMARWVDRVQHPLLVLARVEIGVGLAALVGEHLFDQLPYWFLWLFGRFAGREPLLLISQFLLAFFVMFLPTLLLGAVFPLVVRIYAGDMARVGQRVGTAYAMNTLGTILGAFSAGFILLPALGIQRSITLALIMNLLIGLGLLLVGNSHEKLLFRFTSAVGVVLLIPLAIYAAPMWDPLVMSSGVYKDAPLYLRLYRSPKDVFSRIKSQYRLLFYQEGVTATVTVVERPSLEDVHHLTLSIDGKVDASTAADMPTQILSAHLPLLLAEEAKKVMVIGWASGMTVGSVAQHPVEEIVAVEIEPAVIPASAFFDSYNHQPLKDPRVKLVINDARNHLLISNERFDVIISEPSNPWMSGPSRLFTREFFQLGRERLQRGGIFTQWLQLYGMTSDQLKTLLRTFHSVFPHVLIFQTAEADLILLGSEEELRLNDQRMSERLADPKIAADLQRVKVFHPSDLLVKLRLGSDEVVEFTGPGPYNTDDNALIEFAAPKTIYLETAAANLEEMRKSFGGLADHLAGLGQSDGQRANVYLELAKKYLDLEEWAESLKVAEKSLSLVNTADGHWVRAEVRLARGEDDRAVAEWEEALRQDATHYGALMSLAAFHQRRRNYQEAERPLLDLLASYPNDALAHYFYGVNLYFTGDYELAVEELKMALALGLPKLSLDSQGEEVTQAASLRQRSATSRWWPYFLYEGLENQLAHYYLSLCWARLDDKAEASEQMRAFLEELHVWREALELRPATFTRLKLFRQFQFHQERGMYIEEEASLASLLDRFVAGPLTHFYRGTAEYFLGYYQEAVAELEAALNALGQLGSGARSPLTHYYLGLAYKKLNDRAQATSHLEAFLSDPGSDPNVGLRMADARKQLEEIRHAQATGGVSS